MKSCKNKNCGETNPQSLDNFNKDKTKVDGLQRHCRSCTKRNTTSWMKTNKSKVKDYKSIWDSKHKRNEMLVARYNITTADYDNMLINQDFCCKICKKHESESSKRLHVDHCHKSGKIRGLLCFKCNSGLGYFKDNLDALENACNYLKESLKDD